MKSLKEQLGGLVYSTANGAMCQICRHALDTCICSEIVEQQRMDKLDGIVKIHRETKGRKGKGVTLIKDLPLTDSALKSLAKSMKRHCGSGGAVKDGVIEIQGDHRALLKIFLEKQDYTVKLAGA